MMNSGATVSAELGLSLVVPEHGVLSAGLHGPAGEGDVQVWPGDDHGLGVLNIALSSPFGQAHFEAPTTAIADFLNRTFGIIAPGCESDFIDLDGELDELLWRA